jgi:hypothetical protein
MHRLVGDQRSRALVAGNLPSYPLTTLTGGIRDRDEPNSSCPGKRRQVTAFGKPAAANESDAKRLAHTGSFPRGGLR